MRITRLGGSVSNADTTLYQADKIEILMEADAAIPVGYLCAPDSNGNTTGKLVVPTWLSSDGQHHCCGVYEGIGGTGTAAATTGYNGRDAADGDLIFVTCFGPATARQGGISTTGGISIPTASTSAGTLIGLSAVTTVINSAIRAPFMNLDASTAGQLGPVRVWVRCM